jgi:histidinol-phosphate aminotransferase
MLKFKLPVIIKRIRKSSPHPQKGLRLNRAEFGHDFSNKNKRNFFDQYYPDTTSLIDKIAKFHKIKNENLNIGLGAESFIKDIFIWHSRKFKKKRVGFSLPNFFMYTLNAKIYDYKIFNYLINPARINLLNLSYIKNFLEKNKINLFIIVNPSHPFEKNWNLMELGKIMQFCKRKGITVLLDEVYQGLGSESAYKLIQKYTNLIILRSFSKAFGLPGIRVGYTIASAKISQEIETYRLAIELPQYSINEVIKLLDGNKKFLYNTSKQIINSRKYAHKQFKIRGLNSHNFFLNSVNVDLINKNNALKIGNYLKKNNIFINYKYPEPHSHFINLTTTNISNLKFFFKKFDKISDKIIDS